MKYSLILVLVLAACARPNYLPSDFEGKAGVNGGSAAAGEIKPKCDFEFSKLDYCAQLAWEKKPNRRTFGTFVLNFYRLKQLSPNGEPIAADIKEDIEADLDMPSMSHPPTPIDDIDRLGPGSFRMRNIYFSMRGEWLINIRLGKNKKVLDSAALRIDY